MYFSDMDSGKIAKAREILAHVPCEKCVLFGSRARGDAGPESDYDFLLIVSDTSTIEQKMSLASLVRKKMADAWINADVIVRTVREVDYLRDKPGSVVRNALEEGVAV